MNDEHSVNDELKQSELPWLNLTAPHLVAPELDFLVCQALELLDLHAAQSVVDNVYSYRMFLTQSLLYMDSVFTLYGHN